MEKSYALDKKIVKLVVPISFQQFMLALVGASDAVMLGKLNQNSMSAVSLASQVTFLFNLFMAAFIIGENMYVAQYYGKKDYANISKIFYLVLRLSCIVAIFFTAGTIFFPENIMYFFTDEPRLIVMGSEYLKYIGVSYILSATAQVYITLMKNCGAVTLSTIISSATVLLNILLNAVLIFGLFGFPARGDSGFGLLCDTVTLWCITIPLGCLCPFVLKSPILAVYFVLNLDEIVKLLVVYRHYKKYGWVKNIT